MQDKHIFFMKEAIKEAKKAYKKDEVPVGSIIVKDNTIIARAHNLIKTKKDPVLHAEILAIQKASKFLKNERLINTEMYVTLEPCPMCAYAIVLARIKRLIFSTRDFKTGACGSVYNIINNKKNNHKVEVIEGFLKEESSKLLKNFFKGKRSKKL